MTRQDFSALYYHLFNISFLCSTMLVQSTVNGILLRMQAFGLFSSPVIGQTIQLLLSPFTMHLNRLNACILSRMPITVLKTYVCSDRLKVIQSPYPL